MKQILKISVLLLFFSSSIIIACNNNGTSHSSINDTTPSMLQDTVLSQTAEDKLGLNNYDRDYNDLAVFLSGQKGDVGSRYTALEGDAGWLAHRDSFERFFTRIERDRFPALQNFAQTELSKVNDNFNTLLYPYSGPDFGHASLFFPNAKQIIMLALEPVGTVPNVQDMTEKDFRTFFGNIGKTLMPIFNNSSYFYTNDMGQDFSGTDIQLNGVTPVLYILISRMGFKVLHSRPIMLDKEGKVLDSISRNEYIDKPQDGLVNGVEFTYYKEGDDFIRKLYYFSHDVSDTHLKTTPELVTFLESQNITASYFKAASYINRWFATIRTLCLNKSNYIFQDDSGIPIKYFDTKVWDIQLYGSYVRTLQVFKDAFQPDLKQMYDTYEVKPLDFGIGYNNNFGHPNLMIATKK